MTYEEQLKYMKGFFFCIEGPDYSGKSTQIKKLVKSIEAKGAPYVLVREPGGTEFGESMRNNIFKYFGKVNPVSEALCLLAAKAELTQKVILPAMAEGKIVIADRYTPSLYAYQGGGHCLGKTFIDGLVASLGQHHIYPDVTALLQISVAEAEKRRALRGIDNSIDAASPAFRHNVIIAYNQMASHFPNCVRVNAGLSETETNSEIIKIYNQAFAAKLSRTAESDPNVTVLISE